MNDLRLDEVHTAFLDSGYVSLAVLQEGLSREVCFKSVFAQVTETQERLCHLASDSSPDFTFSVILGFLQNHVGQTWTDAPLSIITKPSS